MSTSTPNPWNKLFRGISHVSFLMDHSYSPYQRGKRRPWHDKPILQRKLKTNQKVRLCISRESNTGPIDGNDGFYH
ncbi:hypothetical protein F4679DRAFT_139965 [Xylaria curta]|nr:hypothetical protein F4679DRAFT_139965 [Xylaria curta]